jgi:hypothetical protein
VTDWGLFYRKILLGVNVPLTFEAREKSGRLVATGGGNLQDDELIGRTQISTSVITKVFYEGEEIITYGETLVHEGGMLCVPMEELRQSMIQAAVLWFEAGEIASRIAGEKVA